MNNPMFALKGPKMKDGAKGYDTNFPLEHAQKDVRFAQALGDDLGISMSVSSAANGTSLHFYFPSRSALVFLPLSFFLPLSVRLSLSLQFFAPCARVYAKCR